MLPLRHLAFTPNGVNPGIFRKESTVGLSSSRYVPIIVAKIP